MTGTHTGFKVRACHGRAEVLTFVSAAAGKACCTYFILPILAQVAVNSKDENEKEKHWTKNTLPRAKALRTTMLSLDSQDLNISLNSFKTH